jgi:DNA-binding response OmpR family regulator
MRVLVVESDVLIRGPVCEVLVLAGVETGEAGSCQAALALMAAASWDVLLTDLMFSGALTGLDLADEAAERGIRCVVASGAVNRREEVEARGLSFLAKPFRTAALLAALELAPD